jgi:hypothetical protein
MKTTKYILILIFLSAVFACEDTIYPDPLQEPIKAVGLNIADFDVLIMPDGSLATVVEDKNDKTFRIAVVSRNGVVDYYPDYIPLTGKNDSTLFYMDVTETGMFFGYQQSDEKEKHIIKYDENGKIVYEKSFSKDLLVTALSNGELALFDQTEYGLYMYMIDNNGEVKNFTYSMETDKHDFQGVKSFEDKIVLYDYYSYSVFRTDGSFVSSVNFDSSFVFVDMHYADGNIYLYGGFIDELGKEDIVHQYYIKKMDIFGNEIYTASLRTSFLFIDKITVYDGELIVTSAFLKDSDGDEGMGAIFLIDDTSGDVKDQVILDYKNCDVMPYIILPDKYGEYDVFTIRRDNYDDWTDFQKGEFGMDNGRLFIYHTDDLHKLQMEN